MDRKETCELKSVSAAPLERVNEIIRGKIQGAIKKKKKKVFATWNSCCTFQGEGNTLYSFIKK